MESLSEIDKYVGARKALGKASLALLALTTPSVLQLRTTVVNEHSLE
jgi:hypothetical protein